MKLWIHIGLAKCASTSLQHALRDATGITYPRSGRLHPQAEHLALPLHLTGVDDWRRQWVSDSWAATETASLLREIAQSQAPAAVSSELLASLTPDRISCLADLLVRYDVQILLLVRDKRMWLESTWRHLVYHHDYTADLSSFLRLKSDFRFEDVAAAFEKRFQVHVFDIDEHGFDRRIMELIGASFAMRRENTGVPVELADILQRQHAALGSSTFKAIFTQEVKSAMRDKWRRSSTAAIEPYTGPPF